MASTKSQKLEDQGGAKGQSSSKAQPKGTWPLDEDNKLSSAGAATSLKYASPKDLPSYPTTGIPNTDSSAGAAASLANANHKEFEHWRPEGSTPATKAAMMAKDYKMAPLWQPEQSAAGSKAALLAQKDGGQVDVWRPETTDAGNSAAGQAMRAKGLVPNVDAGVTEEGERKALLAATGAISGSRRRSGSTPTVKSQYPDSENAASNALSAATVANKPAKKAPQPAPAPVRPPINAKKIHDAAVTNLSREMYTSHPPVAPELEEQNRQAGLRAAAMSMAKQMYDIQQRAISEAGAGRRPDSHYAAASVHNRADSVASSDDSHYPPAPYVNLQEAAQKLAAERLAKLNDEHAAYRNYYGQNSSKPQSKLSIRGRQRRRASSDGQSRGDDEERSMQIRSEMSLFQDKLAQVDAKKRQKDRDSLLAAAQRNVRASMHGMDERVFSETGKASPAMMEEWEAKAKARAEADSSARMTNHGKVNIGGGKYLDQSEVDAIAAAKVQPTLDEVSAKAEQQRARDEQIRAEREERVRIAREKEEDQKLRDQMTKEEWQRFKYEEKREAQARKDEEKARKAEEKRNKRKSKDTKGVEVPGEVSETESEPPALDPIPTTEPITVEQPSIESSNVEESNLEPTSTTDTKLGSTTTDEPATSVEPETTRESTLAQAGPLDAEIIAERVLSAPVEDEISKLSTPAAPTMNDPKAKDVPESPVAKSPETSPASPIKHTEPVTSRIAPSIPPGPATALAQAQSGTKTTVSAGDPKSPSKDGKSEGKVSSWLKNKLKRSNKTAKSTSEPGKEASSESAPQEKGFVGGAALAATSNSSVNRTGTGDSEREVAMAGKPLASAAPAPPTTTTTTTDGDLYSASPAAAGQPRRSLSSSSISSLSSSEDETRGRTRLAREPKPMTHNLRQSLRGEHPVGPIAAGGAEAVDPAPAATGTGRNLDRDSSSDEAASEEFEEAKDTFDSEALKPPKTVGAEGGGRASDSPVRDSKFSEDL
ncbi:MAG: hypothetical protein Q9191_001083 [Dirinaria sp. TL-2023a]